MTHRTAGIRRTRTTACSTKTPVSSRSCPTSSSGNYAALPGINWGRGNMLTPMIYDILVIQGIYGADTTTRAGDTVYGFNSTAGRNVFDFAWLTAQHVAPVLTIYDAGGNDTLDLSGFSANQSVDLTDGSMSDVGSLFNGDGTVGAALIGNLGIAFGAIIENAIGGSGNDTLRGNAAGNVLSGRAGNDTLHGADGNDVLDGGAGVNVPVRRRRARYRALRHRSAAGPDHRLDRPRQLGRHQRTGARRSRRARFDRGVPVQRFGRHGDLHRHASASASKAWPATIPWTGDAGDDIAVGRRQRPAGGLRRRQHPHRRRRHRCARCRHGHVRGLWRQADRLGQPWRAAVGGERSRQRHAGGRSCSSRTEGYRLSWTLDRYAIPQGASQVFRPALVGRRG